MSRSEDDSDQRDDEDANESDGDDSGVEREVNEAQAVGELDTSMPVKKREPKM